MPPPLPKGGRKKAPAADEADFLAPVEIAPPDELKVRRRELEDRFKRADGPLDAPDRVALWPQLARLNAALKEKSEAAICWTSAFWELPEVPADGSWGWLHTEDPAARKVPTADEWDAALAVKMPSPEAARGVAARVVHACRQKPVPESFVHRLPKIREYLERHERARGAGRLAGLVAPGRAGAVGEDVKALAHVRDRLLQRLLAEGLNKERDLPIFLRTAGEQNSERMRLVRDRALRVHRLVEKWHAGEDVRVNKPYVDLMFAFGLAKLGEATAARDLLKQAEDTLLEPSRPADPPDKAHAFLLKAFVYRIENALQGRPHTGPLPPDMMAKLEKLDDGRGLAGINPRYIADRMRDISWILEPQEKPDPYRDSKRHATEAHKTLADLVDVKDPARIAETIRKLIRANHPPDVRVVIYQYGISLGPRVGEDFTIPLVQQVPAVLEASLTQPGPQVHLGEGHRKLFERALFMAAHYDRAELIQTLFRYFLEFLRQADGRGAVHGRQRRRPRVPAEPAEARPEGRDQPVPPGGVGPDRPGQVPAATPAGGGQAVAGGAGPLLALAEGWLFFGGFAQAKPILDEARATIFDNGRSGKDKGIVPITLTRLMQAYISALGQGPVDEALNRIEELFQRLEKLPNTFTTAPYFSRLHLYVVEEVVRSLMSDNLALGDQARRWLDDDEYLVRRRIHGGHAEAAGRARALTPSVAA